MNLDDWLKNESDALKQQVYPVLQKIHLGMLKIMMDTVTEGLGDLAKDHNNANKLLEATLRIGAAKFAARACVALGLGVHPAVTMSLELIKEAIHVVKVLLHER